MPSRPQMCVRNLIYRHKRWATKAAHQWKDLGLFTDFSHVLSHSAFASTKTFCKLQMAGKATCGAAFFMPLCRARGWMHLSKTVFPSLLGTWSQQATGAASDLLHHVWCISFHIKKPSICMCSITYILEWTGEWTHLSALPAVLSAPESCEAERCCPLGWVYGCLVALELQHSEYFWTHTAHCSHYK